VFKCERNCDRLLKDDAYQSLQKNKKARGVVNKENHQLREQRGFTTQDILWALASGLILTLSPVVASIC